MIQNFRETQQYVQLEKSKLLNLKNHLEALIRKKYRLEVEIKSLKKTISKKTKLSDKNIKIKLNAESTNYEDFLDPNTVSVLEQEAPEMLHDLAEFTQIQFEIEEILSELDSEN